MIAVNYCQAKAAARTSFSINSKDRQTSLETIKNQPLFIVHFLKYGNLIPSSPSCRGNKDLTHQLALQLIFV